ncbi:MAG TPA: glycosyltransferase family 4 protein [Candidatus Dormibacteraeota bacterium]|nr:glycosyltransferase family 4 protein [Candidatus Dormibacteraeota bacterium]
MRGGTARPADLPSGEAAGPRDTAAAVSERIRVLFVEASSGGVLGGSLTGLYHIMRGMDRSRFDIGMVLYEPKPIEADLARLDVPVHHVARRRLPKQHGLLELGGYQRAKRLGVVRQLLRSGRQTARLLAEELPAALALARIIRRERADVIHLGNGVRANFDGILAGILTGVPVLCHVKGFEKYGARERWAARHTILVCMTQAVLDACHANGVRAPVERIVYDAVDETWLQPQRDPADIRRELGIPASAPCLGIAGNIQEWKGQRVLVDALGLLADRPDVHCVIAGGVHRAGEAYAAALRARIAELGLGERVHLTGFRADIPDVMNAWDVIVHASVRPEPFGRVILEGMLLGKPVIATAAGGVPELISHEQTGYLVPPGDAPALAAQLRQLLADPDRARAIGARSRDWARERFALGRHVAEMSQIYTDAARTRHA